MALIEASIERLGLGGLKFFDLADVFVTDWVGLVYGLLNHVFI